MEEFTKQCPVCGKDQQYGSWDSLRNALRKQTICNVCSSSKKRINPPDGKWQRVCKCGNIMKYSCRRSYNAGKRKNSECRNCATKTVALRVGRDVFKTPMYREKMSRALKLVRQMNNYGEDFKRKCRENKLVQISKQGVQRTFNKTACEFMDSISKRFGFRLQHGLNGGEVQIIGYSLDGYDKDRNVVFEYDEPKHHALSVKERDLKRQERLIGHLHPALFLRYDEKNRTLKDVLTGKEMV